MQIFSDSINKWNTFCFYKSCNLLWKTCYLNFNRFVKTIIIELFPIVHRKNVINIIDYTLLLEFYYTIQLRLNPIIDISRDRLRKQIMKYHLNSYYNVLLYRKYIRQKKGSINKEEIHIDFIQCTCISGIMMIGCFFVFVLFQQDWSIGQKGGCGDKYVFFTKSIP